MCPRKYLPVWNSRLTHRTSKPVARKMAALTKFFWNTAKNLATAATGVLAPAAEPTPASLEGEAGLGSELEQPQSETDEEEKGEEEKEDGGAEYGSLLFRAEARFNFHGEQRGSRLRHYV